MFQVQTCVWTNEALDWSEVSQVHNAWFLALTYVNAIWSQVPMQVAVIMQNLQSLNHLRPQVQHSFEAKPLLTKIEQFLSIRAQKWKYHTIEVTLDAFPVDLRKSG